MIRISDIVAGLALLVSVSSFGYGLWQADQTQKYQRRTEFRSALEKSLAVSLKRIELAKQNLTDAQRSEGEDALGKQREVLARQALDIYRTSSAGVTFGETLTLGEELDAIGDPANSELLLKQAQRLADNPYNFAWAARALGSSYFAHGRTSDGEQEFERALKAFERFNDFRVAEPEKQLERAVTLVYWAQRELEANNCNQSKVRAESALTLLRDLPSNFRFPGSTAEKFETTVKRLRLKYKC